MRDSTFPISSYLGHRSTGSEMALDLGVRALRRQDGNECERRLRLVVDLYLRQEGYALQ